MFKTTAGDTPESQQQPAAAAAAALPSMPPPRSTHSAQQSALSEEMVARYLARKPNFLKRWFKDNAPSELLQECIRIKEQKEYLNKPRTSLTHEMFENIIHGNRSSAGATDHRRRATGRLHESERARIVLRVDSGHRQRIERRRAVPEDPDQRLHSDQFRPRKFVFSAGSERILATSSRNCSTSRPDRRWNRRSTKKVNRSSFPSAKALLDTSHRPKNTSTFPMRTR